MKEFLLMWFYYNKFGKKTKREVKYSPRALVRPMLKKNNPDKTMEKIFLDMLDLDIKSLLGQGDVL